MKFSDLFELSIVYVIILGYTSYNLFGLFIQLIFGLSYNVLISKEITFYYYSFFGILLWMVITLYIINLRTPRNDSRAGDYFKYKIVNFFIRKNIKNVYIALKDKKILYGVLLSVFGGFLGLFSLGNLYLKLYKRFMIQVILGLLLTILNLITISAYPLTLNISDIVFYFWNYPFFAITPVIYYVFTVNDTYECALSLKNNDKLPLLSKIDVLFVFICLFMLLLITLDNLHLSVMTDLVFYGKILWYFLVISILFYILISK